MIVFIGSVAALLTALCWVPQVVRTLRRGSAEDFGWHYLALLLTGVALWCLYGIVRDDPPIYLCNGFVLAMVLVVVAVKLRADETGTVETQFEAAETEP
jgi:MtN3 and saliva related transmembrane protein